MQVFIRSGGRVWSMDLRRIQTVDEMKNAIYNLQAIPVKNQNLIFAGKRLESGHTLAEYGIYKDCLIDLVFPASTHHLIKLNPPSPATVADLQEIFPDLPEEEISSVVMAFHKLEKDDMAMYLLLHKDERLDARRAVRMIFPDKSRENVEAVVGRTASDVNHALFRVMSQGSQEAIQKERVSDEVTMLSVIEVDMHGLAYKPSEWSAPIRWTMEYSEMFDIDKVCFIPGKGLHSKDGVPKLRPTVMATLTMCGYNPYIDPLNSGLVWCDVKDKRDWHEVDQVEEDDGPELLEMAEEFPNFPKRVLQDLVILGQHVMKTAKYLGHKLEEQLEAGISAVVDKKENARYQSIGEFFLHALQEFENVPRPIIKKFGFDTAPDDERKRELRHAEEAIASGKIKAEELEELFKQAPNVPLHVLVDALAEGKGEDAVYSYLTRTMQKIDTKQQAFKFRLRLRGTRLDGMERIQPILYINIVHASKEKAQRYIDLALERLLDREVDWKKICIHCPVIGDGQSGLSPREAKLFVKGRIRGLGKFDVFSDGETVYVEDRQDVVEMPTKGPKKDGAVNAKKGPKKDGAARPKKGPTNGAKP